MRAVFTTRKYNMGFPAPGRKRLGFFRKQAYKKIGLTYSRLVCPSQVHGDTVFIAGPEDRGRGVYTRSNAIPRTDALITNQRHLPLAILTADCLPVFIFDNDKKAIAVVHAGWKGLHQQIIAKTIRRMCQVFKVSPEDLIIAIGPGIRPCCYEVGKDFLTYFKAGISRKGSKIYFDLAQAAGSQMKDAGVRADHIYDSHICTSCMNSEFFSYRREGEAAGRSMAVMELQ